MFLARSGFVGPRLAKVVPPALYAGAVAEGRGWKYRGFVNDCAASLEPTTFPFTLRRLPSALPGKVTWAKPLTIAGMASPKASVSTITAIAEDLRSRAIRE